METVHWLAFSAVGNLILFSFWVQQVPPSTEIVAFFAIFAAILWLGHKFDWWRM